MNKDVSRVAESQSGKEKGRVGGEGNQGRRCPG